MTTHDPPSAARPCPHADCRHSNPPQARYCARCGRRLEPQSRVGWGTLLGVLVGGVALVAVLGWLGIAVWSGLGLIAFGFIWRSDDPRAAAR